MPYLADSTQPSRTSIAIRALLIGVPVTAVAQLGIGWVAHSGLGLPFLLVFAPGALLAFFMGFDQGVTRWLIGLPLQFAYFYFCVSVYYAAKRLLQRRAVDLKYLWLTVLILIPLFLLSLAVGFS